MDFIFIKRAIKKYKKKFNSFRNSFEEVTFKKLDMELDLTDMRSSRVREVVMGRTLFENEEASDVVFLVGEEPEIWRFAGHSNVLSKNRVFNAMLNGQFPRDAERVISVIDLDGKAFEMLMRHLYSVPYEITSLKTAINTLYAASKYLCLELVAECIRYLDESINITDVLEIYQLVRFFAGQFNYVTTQEDASRVVTAEESVPSAPVYQHDMHLRFGLLFVTDALTNPDARMGGYFNSLIKNCQLFIDENADQLLLKDELMKDLTYEALIELVSRDSFNISNELRLFQVIDEWSKWECKRRQFKVNSQNCARVIGDKLLFSVRYLLMDSKDFWRGPMHSKLFTDDEKMLMLGLILKHSQTAAPFCPRITPIIDTLRREREEVTIESIPLSNRSLRPARSTKKKKDKSPNKEHGKLFKCTVNVLSSLFD